MSASLTDLLPTFERLTKKPEEYLSVQNTVASNVTDLLKSLYDFTKTAEESAKYSDALPELIVQGFDQEQIWQELELQNNGCSSSFVTDVSTLVARKDRLAFLLNVEAEVEPSEDETSDIGKEDVSEEEEDEEAFTDKKKRKKRKGLSRVTEVDDKFFKVSEMEEFLEREERQEQGSSDESVDMFRISDREEDDDTDNEARYSDFFDAPYDEEEQVIPEKKRKKKKGEEDEEEEEEEEGEGNRKRVRFLFGENDEQQEMVKSTLEARQERLNTRIKQLEEQAMAEKPWQLRGEVVASARPQNSLLEEVVDFDFTTRPAPVMTEKTTMQLEDIIRLRVRDKTWDDVERKVKPVETPNEYKKKLVLDQEKSKLSLSQVYEQEFMKQQEALNEEESEKPEEESPEHKEVQKMMTALFAKLEALSNFHYTPRAPAPEIKIVSNIPAISVEEVAPVATSAAAMLAPEEVKAHRRGDDMGKSERTATDKKRERRKKKAYQRERQQEREKRERAVQKLNPGLGNKYSKERALRDLETVTKKGNVTQMDEMRGAKSVKSSKAFFTRLEDEVKTFIKKKTAPNMSNLPKNALSAKKFKL